MRAAARILDRIRAGDRLHMQYVAGHRVWWFEQPHQLVAEKLVAALIADPQTPIREAGDSLFGLPMMSQTFFAAEG